MHHELESAPNVLKNGSKIHVIVIYMNAVPTYSK